MAYLTPINGVLTGHQWCIYLLTNSVLFPVTSMLYIDVIPWLCFLSGTTCGLRSNCSVSFRSKSRLQI